MSCDIPDSTSLHAFVATLQELIVPPAPGSGLPRVACPCGHDTQSAGSDLTPRLSVERLPVPVDTMLPSSQCADYDADAIIERWVDA